MLITHLQKVVARYLVRVSTRSLVIFHRLHQVPSYTESLFIQVPRVIAPFRSAQLAGLSKQLYNLFFPIVPIVSLKVDIRQSLTTFSNVTLATLLEFRRRLFQILCNSVTQKVCSPQAIAAICVAHITRLRKVIYRHLRVPFYPISFPINYPQFPTTVGFSIFAGVYEDWPQQREKRYTLLFRKSATKPFHIRFRTITWQNPNIM